MILSLQDIHPADYDILIVDDNPENLKVLGNFLVEQGFNVRVARDGQQALDSVAAQPPELVLLDIHMPVLDGYDTCRRLKADEHTADIPVIFLSALGETFNKLRAFELGASDYISKPFELEEVRMRVNVHLLANRLLAESRAGFRASFEQAAAGMLHVHLNGTIIAANQRLCEMLALGPTSLIGNSAFEVLHDGLSHCLRSAIEQLQSGALDESPVEVPVDIPGRDTSLWCKVTCSAVRIAANREPYIAAIVQDITDRKLADRERRRILVALEHAPDAIALTDTEGRVLYANRAYQESRNLLGTSYIGHVHSLFAPQPDPNAPSPAIQETVREKGLWHGRTTIVLEDGTKRVEAHSVSAVLDAGEPALDYVIVSRDISAQLKLEGQLRQAQKMEAIGTLAAGIAHDFNNLLAVISGFTELALDDIPAATETHNSLREVTGAVERARELVRQILAFARQSEFQIRPVQLTNAIQEVARLLRRTIPPTIEIGCELDETCPPILADATAIHQILMNLCTNAYHAMEENGGVLGLRLTHARIEANQLQGHPDLTPGEYARIEVSDTGHGMDENTRQRIFEPYFTTKEHAGGTGLGLATVHGIVSDLHGAIHVYSEPGMGSTFSIILPTAVEPQSLPAESTSTTAAGNGEHVLFVDDESTICRFAGKALERLGYRATTLSDPKRALELLRSAPAEYDVIVTDEMMPGMRGSELLAQVREIVPKTPVILYSGFAGSHHKRIAPEVVFDAYVMKPMVTAELSRAIRGVLDRAKA